jgi:uncharacterized delta-60 repeat protein
MRVLPFSYFNQVVEVAPGPPPVANKDYYIGGTFTSFNGTTYNRFLKLYNDGTEDTAFNTNLGTGFNATTSRLIVQSDGKIYVTGAWGTFNSNTRNRLVRINTDGTEDTAFYTNLGTGFGVGTNTVGVQSDGKIIVAGTFTTFNGNTRNRMVRLNSDGTEDTGFYTNLGTGFGGSITEILILSDDSIIAIGPFTTLNSVTYNRIIKLNPDGTVDTTFNTNLGVGIGAGTAPNNLSLQSDGKIIVGGGFTLFDGNTRNRIFRLNADGTEDTAFYTNLGTAFGNTNNTIVVDNNGSIIVGGPFTSFNGNTRNRLLKLNSDGTEDTAFYTNLGTAFNQSVNGLIVNTDNTILCGGTFTTLDVNTRNYMVKLNNDGTEDSAFYTNLGTGFGGTTINPGRLALTV